MTVEIRETTVATDETGTFAQLLISDAATPDDEASFRLELLATLPRYQAPLLVQIQREAIGEAIRVLSELHTALLQQIPATTEAHPKTI